MKRNTVLPTSRSTRPGASKLDVPKPPAERERAAGDVGNGVLSKKETRALRVAFCLKTTLLILWNVMQFAWGLSVLLRWHGRIIPFVTPLLIFPPAQVFLLLLAMISVKDVSAMGVVGRTRPVATIASFFPHATLMYNAASMITMTIYLAVILLAQIAVTALVKKNAIWWIVMVLNFVWVVATPCVLLIYAEFAVWRVIRAAREFEAEKKKNTRSAIQRSQGSAAMPPADRETIVTFAESSPARPDKPSTPMINVVDTLDGGTASRSRRQGPPRQPRTRTTQTWGRTETVAKKKNKNLN